MGDGPVSAGEVGWSEAYCPGAAATRSSCAKAGADVPSPLVTAAREPLPTDSSPAAAGAAVLGSPEHYRDGQGVTLPQPDARGEPPSQVLGSEVQVWAP